MEPTIYNPSIYKGAGIYKAGAEGGGGGGGISCIRCCKGYSGYYIDIPVSCTNRNKFEIGFNICGNWAKDGLGIFAGLGSTYYPPILLSDASIDTTSYALSGAWYHNNNTSQVYVKNKIYPKNFIFYHAEMYTTENDNIFKLTDLDGNIIQNSAGYLINEHAVSKIRLFASNSGASGNVPGFEIYYFRLSDALGNIILDLVPDEQNGVPGFTDKVSGNFYAPNNSSAFEAVKARAPL
jgi:hypothetical protein